MFFDLTCHFEGNLSAMALVTVEAKKQALRSRVIARSKATKQSPSHMDKIASLRSQ